ncbi:MAG: hypothetical protein H7322_19340 [Ramlibacter sp.]|nr:hypothetical protein [Ramlibacter sp.]
MGDLRTRSQLVWMHTAQQGRQHDWYAVPLRHLLGLDCTHFFWADDDDIYLRDHVASGLDDLKDHDFSVSRRCGCCSPGPGSSATDRKSISPPTRLAA